VVPGGGGVDSYCDEAGIDGDMNKAENELRNKNEH
jgi:hypothetical protein